MNFAPLQFAGNNVEEIIDLSLCYFLLVAEKTDLIN